MIVAFIDAYKLVFGVEPICRVLRDHNLPIAASTYYAFKNRPSSARAVADERLIPIMKAVHEANFGVYGVRKMWHALKRKGEQIGRDQVIAQGSDLRVHRDLLQPQEAPLPPRVPLTLGVRRESSELQEPAR